MADTRHLKRRHETWFFTLAVPRDLRAKLGRDRIVLSLKTRDLREAQDARWVKRAECTEMFAKLRGGHTPVTAEPLDPQALADINEVALLTYREALGKMETDARQKVRFWDPAELSTLGAEIWQAIEKDNFAPVAKPLAAFCEQHNVSAGSNLYRELGQALLLARLSAIKGRQKALEEGKVSDEPKTFIGPVPIDLMTLQPVRSPGRRGLIFAEVARRFIAERQRDPAFALTAQTKGQYEAAFRLFDQWARQPRLDGVDRRNASDFLDAVASLDPRWGRGPGVKELSFAEIVARHGGHKQGLSAKTVNRYAMALSMVWQFAEDRDDFDGKNPWPRQRRSTAKRRGSSELDKRPFTPAEVRKLLERAPAVTVANDVPTTLPWLTLIGAYSGMRLNEICELEVEDVKETGGIWYFNLTASKTDAGVRVVPVHSSVLGAGLLDYRNGIAKGPLWPGLRPGGPDGKRSWYVSKRFTDYRRGLGLVDLDKVTERDRLDFHSLRRSAITALKHGGIREHEVAEVVGHEHPMITFGVYPDRQKLTGLKAIVEAIRYDF